MAAKINRLKYPVIIAIATLGVLVVLWSDPPSWLQTILHLAPAQPAWPSDYAAAATQAKNEGKPIVLSFTGSDWCPACQELDEYVLNTAIFRDYVAKNLVFVEVDLPQHKSQPAALKEQNLQLSMKYDVHGLPTIIVLSNEGKLLGQMIGYDESGPKSYIAQIEAFMKQGGMSPHPASQPPGSEGHRVANF